MAIQITSVTFDEPLYNAGDLITMTIAYSLVTTVDAGDTVTVNARDVTDNTAASASGSFTVATSSGASSDQVSFTIQDPSGRNWTQHSNADGVAVYTAGA